MEFECDFIEGINMNSGTVCSLSGFNLMGNTIVRKPDQ